MSFAAALLAFAAVQVTFAADPAGQKVALLDQCADQQSVPTRRIEACDKIVEQSSRSPKKRFLGLLWRADALSRAGRNRAAKLAFDRAFGIRDDIGLSYLLRGTHFMRTRQFDKAIPDYTKASELQPGSSAALILRAYAYEMQGQAETAMRDLTRLSDMEPASSSHPYNFARLALSISEEDPSVLHDALDHARRAAEIDPHPLHVQMVAQIQSALGLYEDAAQSYVAATEVGSEIWAQTYAAFLQLHGYPKAGSTLGGTGSPVAAENIRQYLADGFQLAVRLPVRIPDLAELAEGRAHHTAGLN